MPIEVEIKLRLPDKRAAERVLDDSRVRACRMAPFSDTQMKALYFDTPEGALSARKWSLRLRRENGVSVAVCKTMGTQESGFFSRSEWQAPAETLEEAIPLLISEGAPPELAEFTGYLPRCEMDFVRTSAHLRLPGGSIVELAVDCGFLRAGDKTEPLFELELELITGTPESMVELSGFLEEKYGLLRELSSKYARALRLIRSR